MNRDILKSERSANRERRRFLDMLTKVGVSSTLYRAMPLLAGTLASRYAQAAGLPNKRIVFMYLPNGAPPGKWLPKSLTEMNIATEFYAPVASVCEFSQVDMGNGGHGNTWRSMASYNDSCQNTVDGYFAQQFLTAPYKIIRAGVQSAGGELFTREARQGASNIDGPEKLYKALFSGAPPANNNDDSYLRAFKMSQDALASLRKKLSAEEYERINAHQQSLAAIEARIKAASTASVDTSAECKTPAVFSYPASTKPHIVDEGKAVSDIIIAALKCGLTNVATIQLSTDQAGWFPQGRIVGGQNIQDSLNHHNFSHSGNDLNTAKVVGLLGQVPAYFIGQLMKTNGPDGQPLINTTVFVQVTDMGDGNHGLAGAPFLAASKMAGFSAKSTSGGSHKTFMESIINRVGLPGVKLEA